MPGGDFPFSTIATSWLNAWLVLPVWLNNTRESVLIALCRFVSLSDVGAATLRFVMDAEESSELIPVTACDPFGVTLCNCAKISISN